MFIILLGFICVHTCAQETLKCGSPSPASALSEEGQKKFDSYSARIVRGDETVFAEISEFPPEVVVPYLASKINLNDPSSERYRIVGQALRGVRGIDLYLKSRLETATAAGRVDVEAFGLLAAMGGEKAAEIVAPYLFDFTATPMHGDQLSEVNFEAATFALSRMQLPDMPTKRAPVLYSTEDFVAWQKWAVDRGFVPKTWRSRVGSEEMKQKLEGQAAPFIIPEGESWTPPKGTKSNVLSGADAASIVPQNAKLSRWDEPDKDRRQESQSGKKENLDMIAAIVVFGVFVLLFIGATIFLFAHRKRNNK